MLPCDLASKPFQIKDHQQQSMLPKFCYTFKNELKAKNLENCY